MNFRILVPAGLPIAERQRLVEWLVEVGHEDAAALEARLAKEPPWIVDVPGRDEAEELQEVLRSGLGVHFPLTPVFADAVPSRADLMARLRGHRPSPVRGGPPAPPPVAPGPPESEPPLELARETSRPPPRDRPSDAERLPDLYVAATLGEAAPKDRWYQGRPARWWLQAVAVTALVLGGVLYLAWPAEPVIARGARLATRANLGPHCSPGSGWYEISGVRGAGPVLWKSSGRYVRDDPNGQCEKRTVRNPLGCDVVLLAGQRGLRLGKRPALELLFEVPKGAAGLRRGTYAVDTLPGPKRVRWRRYRKKLRIEAPVPEPKGLKVSSNEIRCARWVGEVTVHSLGWRASGADAPPVEASVSWDLQCKRIWLPKPMGGPGWPEKVRPKTRGCVSQGKSRYRE